QAPGRAPAGCSDPRECGLAAALSYGRQAIVVWRTSPTSSAPRLTGLSGARSIARQYGTVRRRGRHRSLHRRVVTARGPYLWASFLRSSMRLVDYLIGPQQDRLWDNRPSALAVLRLMISSSLVGFSTGRSAGFTPFRILST